MNVQNKKITILGAARSGIAAARMLKQAGADVFVSDSAELSQKQAEADMLNAENIEFEFGRHSSRVFEAEFVVLSPGIPLYSETAAKIMAGGIKIYSEIEAASWFCKSPLIAVTGSNGKTTTTALIGEMLRKKYPNAFAAGNIGRPFSDYVMQSDAGSWAVVEVSSFQLETIERFHPQQAVVLNFAPNHLDRYPGGYKDYLKAKWRVTKNLSENDHLIYNSSDVELSKWADLLKTKKSGFDINGLKDTAAWYADDVIYLNGEKLIDTGEIILRGKHNYMNAMAAALAADTASVSLESIKETLREFEGVEHRLEFAAEKNGVKYINDSKATTVESLSFALQSFKEPIILIAGGKDKGSNFTKLNKLIKNYVKAVVLIGVAAEKIETAWKGIKPIHKAVSMQDAVEKAGNLADSGDVVLLSPACASFDMFDDFEDRGRQFKELVLML